MAATALPPLSAAEMTKVREAFDKFDEDKSGAIDMWELRKVLQSMGQCPSEEDLLQMIMEVDEDGSGQIEFDEFVKMIQIQMSGKMGRNESDTIEAFIALGGNADKTGSVTTESLKSIIDQFELSINIQELINEYDADNSGFIDFEEFSAMLSDEGQN